MAEEKEQAKKKGEEKKEAKEKPKGSFISKVLKFFLWIFIVTIITSIISLLLLGIAGFLAYNFLVIKTINLCIGDEIEKTPITCASDNECVIKLNELVKNQNITSITGIEVFEPLLKEISSNTGMLSCYEGYCAIKKPRGFEEMLKGGQVECGANETKKTIKLTPKMIVPPDKVKEIIKMAIESKEIKSVIADALKGDINLEEIKEKMGALK